MQLVSPDAVAGYLTNDSIAVALERASQPGDAALTCQAWLAQSEAKRHVFNLLYGDLLKDGPVRSVVDIGGGLTALTREFALRHEYALVDILAHDTDDAAGAMERDAGKNFVYKKDWAETSIKDADIVIANDIFPNVDQRLELFLETWLPRALEVRLSLTFYDTPRYYFTKRLDGEEIFCFLAWTSDQTRRVLARFADRIVAYDNTVFDAAPPSCYANGRQVCLVRISGSLTPK